MARQIDIAALYERDFYAWTQRASELLRKGCFAEADIEHVAEEIEDMGKEQKRGLKSQTRRLILHLLKWEFQPAGRSMSWLESISDARLEIADNLEQNPSLKPVPSELPGAVYEQAARKALLETGLDRNYFPGACPYTFEQIVDDEFWPGGPDPDPRNKTR